MSKLKTGKPRTTKLATSRLKKRRAQRTKLNQVPPPGFVSCSIAAAVTGASPRTLRRWATEGRIAARKIGKLWYIDLENARQVAATLKPGPKPR